MAPDPSPVAQGPCDLRAASPLSGPLQRRSVCRVVQFAEKGCFPFLNDFSVWGGALRARWMDLSSELSCPPGTWRLRPGCS